MASRLGASIVGAWGASAKVLLFVESKTSLNYTVQHCSQPFGPCVETDINVTGLVVKGPRVSLCPRAPSRSVTPLTTISQSITIRSLRAVIYVASSYLVDTFMRKRYQRHHDDQNAYINYDSQDGSEKCP